MELELRNVLGTKSVNGSERTKKDDSVALKHKVTKPDTGPAVVHHKEERLDGDTKKDGN